MYTGKYLFLERSGIIGKSRDYNDYCCLCVFGLSCSIRLQPQRGIEPRTHSYKVRPIARVKLNVRPTNGTHGLPHLRRLNTPSLTELLAIQNNINLGRWRTNMPRNPWLSPLRRPGSTSIAQIMAIQGRGTIGHGRALPQDHRWTAMFII